MKQIYLIITFLFICIDSFAQVGINTNDPKKSLHVAGTNSTIRIDGLNSTNNLNNNGSNPASLYVDANGDFKIKRNAPVFALNLNNSDFTGIVNPINCTTGAASTQNLKNGSFTVTQKNWCNVIYEVAIGGISHATLATITNGAPRLLSANLYIDGTLVSRYGTTFANDNYVAPPAPVIANGIIMLSGSVFLELTPGLHTYSLDLVLEGGTHPFRVNFIQANPNNKLQIIEFN